MPTHDTSALELSLLLFCCQSLHRAAGTPPGTARALAEGTTAELGAALIHMERKRHAARSGLPSVLHNHIINQLTSWSRKEVRFSRELVVEASPTSFQLRFSQLNFPGPSLVEVVKESSLCRRLTL